MGEIEIQKTVIYEIQVKEAGPNSWYVNKIGKTFACIPDVVKSQFTGTEIMWKVLGAYCPVKHIKQIHGLVKSQHTASHKEAMKYYS